MDIIFMVHLALSAAPAQSATGGSGGSRTGLELKDRLELKEAKFGSRS
jgi:hypothetical protein